MPGILSDHHTYAYEYAYRHQHADADTDVYTDYYTAPHQHTDNNPHTLLRWRLFRLYDVRELRSTPTGDQ